MKTVLGILGAFVAGLVFGYLTGCGGGAPLPHCAEWSQVRTGEVSFPVCVDWETPPAPSAGASAAP